MNNNTLNRYLHIDMVHSVIFLETFQGKGPIVEIAQRIREEFDNFGLTIGRSHLSQLGESPSVVLAKVRLKEIKRKGY